MLVHLLLRIVTAVWSEHLEVNPQFWPMPSFITGPTALNVFLWIQLFYAFLFWTFVGNFGFSKSSMLVAFPRGKLRHAKVRADFWPMLSFKTVSGKNWASFTPRSPSFITCLRPLICLIYNLFCSSRQVSVRSRSSDCYCSAKSSMESTPTFPRRSSSSSATGVTRLFR